MESHKTYKIYSITQTHIPQKTCAEKLVLIHSKWKYLGNFLGFGVSKGKNFSGTVWILLQVDSELNPLGISYTFCLELRVGITWGL